MIIVKTKLKMNKLIKMKKKLMTFNNNQKLISKTHQVKNLIHLIQIMLQVIQQN